MITIAIPFYNAENYLADAIRSVFAQTYQNWELILIDDGSTDGSLKIAQSVKDPRVKVVSDGINRRLATRLNEVTKMAEYDFIARMDADDLIFPERLERQMQYFNNDPNLDIVTTGVYSVKNDLSVKGIRGWNYEYPTFNDVVEKKTPVVHAALIAKKSWYQRHPYDETLRVAQDLDLWLRASSISDFKIKSITDPLYIYREENNITSDKILRAYKNERDMLFKYSSGFLTLKRLLILYFKTIVIKGLNISGKMEAVQSKRSHNKINKKLQYNLEHAIKTIRSTHVPGLNH